MSGSGKGAALFHEVTNPTTHFVRSPASSSHLSYTKRPGNIASVRSRTRKMHGDHLDPRSVETLATTNTPKARQRRARGDRRRRRARPGKRHLLWLVPTNTALRLIGMSPGLAGLFAPINLYPASSTAAEPIPFCPGEKAPGAVVSVGAYLMPENYDTGIPGRPLTSIRR